VPDPSIAACEASAMAAENAAVNFPTQWPNTGPRQGTATGTATTRLCKGSTSSSSKRRHRTICPTSSPHHSSVSCSASPTAWISG
jgi:hypothetical protein